MNGINGLFSEPDNAFCLYLWAISKHGMMGSLNPVHPVKKESTGIQNPAATAAMYQFPLFHVFHFLGRGGNAASGASPTAQGGHRQPIPVPAGCFIHLQHPLINARHLLIPLHD